MVVGIVICSYKPCSIKAKIQQRCEIIEGNIKEIIAILRKIVYLVYKILFLKKRLQFPTPQKSIQHFDRT
jgi:hypothetical protein